MKVVRKNISSRESSMLCGVGKIEIVSWGTSGALDWGIRGGQCGRGRPELRGPLCAAFGSRLKGGHIPSELRSH